MGRNTGIVRRPINNPHIKIKQFKFQLSTMKAPIVAEQNGSLVSDSTLYIHTSQIHMAH